MSDPDDPMAQQSADEGRGPVPVSKVGIVLMASYLIVFTLIIVLVLWDTIPSCDVPPVVETGATGPVVRSILPARALAAGGESVRILGDRFKSGAIVTLGTEAPIRALFVSPWELVLSAPKHDPGILDVKVSQDATSQDGKVLANGESDTLKSALQFLATQPSAPATPPPAPPSIQISGVEPSTVQVNGGYQVTITGNGFTPGSLVRFGGVPARQVRVDGPHVITAVTPVHGAGPVAVLVANDQSFNSLDGRLTFVCPAAPDRTMVLMVLLAGALGGLVHALRSFFWYVGERKLLWNWAPMYVLLPFASSALALVFYLVIRAGLYQPTAGTSLLLVGLAAIVGMFSTQAVEKLKAIAEGLFSPAPKGRDSAPPAAPSNVTAPTFTGLKPASGPVSGANRVTITGAGFASPATVRFGTALATQVTVSDATTLKAVAPPGTAGKVAVAVATGGKPEIVKADAYLYVVPKGKILSVTPAESPIAGGTVVTITGEAFTADAVVTFGDAVAPKPTLKDATTLEVKTPSQLNVGTVDIRIDAGTDLVALSPGGFTYKV